MVSGHRRMHAAQLAGLTTIPAIVRELSNDDAIVAMVDANIQREELLPSEKAFAYKMKFDPELLDLVDNKKLQFTVAVDISYIDKKIQEWIYEYISDTGLINPVRHL